MDKIEEKFDVNILFRPHQVRNKYTSKQNIFSDSLASELEELLAPLHVTFERVNAKNYIIVAKEEPVPTDATQETVTGTVTVTDAQSGETLPGVNILVKGTTTGASTDENGNYELNVESLQDTLVVSFIGYQTREVAINGQTEINIALQPQAIAGEEMVVIGYGTATKNNLATSIGTVEISDKAQTQSITNLEQFFQGSVPGLNAGLATGEKGETTLEVRGRNSINARNSPLIVIDGMPFYGSLSSINPYDIKSIHVLKDATAAVYGASSAGGIIEITTKQGRSSVPTITFSSSIGFAEGSWDQRPRGPADYIDQRADTRKRLLSSGESEFYYDDPRSLPEAITVDEWLALDPATSGSPVEVWLNRIGF